MTDKGLLFLGEPIPIDNICMVYPYTVRQVLANQADYHYKVNLITMTILDFKKIFGDDVIQDDNISAFDLYLLLCEESGDYTKTLLDTIQTFVHEEVHFLPRNGFLIGNIEEERLLDKKHFFTFQNIIRAMNHIEEEEIIPENETWYERKRRINREKVKQAKRREQEKTQSNIPMVISVAALPMLNIGISQEEVQNISMFKFRLLEEMGFTKQKYDSDINALLAGVDNKKAKIKPKYWIKNYFEK